MKEYVRRIPYAAIAIIVAFLLVFAVASIRHEYG
jgi:hypothetical protein